jgi:hypothetical protein
MTQLLAHPVTCVIITLYVANVIWYLTHRHWGMAVYWFAAALITFSVTWLAGWKS